MKRLGVVLLALLLASQVSAMPSCIGGPAASENKALHFVGTAAISAGIAAATQSASLGFWAGIAAGAARELWKEHHGDRCEYSSMAYDLAGAAAGSWAVQHWYILPMRGGVGIGYTRAF